MWLRFGEGAMKSHTEYLVFETRKRREVVHITNKVGSSLSKYLAFTDEDETQCGFTATC